MPRSLVLFLILAVSLSAIYILPPFKQVESALDSEIPSLLGDWRNTTYPPSQKELNILAKDTQFSKAHCQLPRREEMSFITGRAPVDQADLSIVVSGYDLNNSIHRPERCMPAQGHKIYASSPEELAMPDGRQVPVTRLLSKQTLQTADGKEREFDSLTYYFFVGHDAVIRSHTERTLIDIKDRVLKGTAQRWSYISASLPFDTTEGERPLGAPLSREAADKKIRQLLSELADHNIDWQQVNGG